MNTAAVTFDTHKFIKHLRDKGISEPQAEAIVEVVTQARENDMLSAATKADLRELELQIEAKLKDLQIRLGGMIVALGGILVAVKYFG